MDDFSKELNLLLVDTFNSILRMEENMLKTSGGINLSIGEMHLLEAVGKGKPQGRTISSLARERGLTLPSVTVAVNKLVKKGYVEKQRCEEDSRSVRVKLTTLGQRAERLHSYFHQKMVEAVTLDLEEEEKGVLLKGIIKLNAFFTRNADSQEA
jgi:DNA-binding MarR family transcriptional regulator